MREKSAILAVGIPLVILFLTMSVLAFAVSSPYMENKELKITLSESRDLEFVLQNGGPSTDLDVRADILEGSAIAKITDSNNIYKIPTNSKATVHVTIKAPSNASIGDSYKVRIGFSSAPSGGGSVFGSAIEQNFNVIIGKKPQPPSSTAYNSKYIYIGIILLALIVILVVFLKKRKAKKQRNI